MFENIDDPTKKDQELSIMERAVILGLLPIAHIILWKIKRARTYGDLMKLGKFLESKSKELEEKYPDSIEREDEEMITILTHEATIVGDNLKNL